MYQDERKLDFKPLGIAIKKAREAKGWTQEYLAQLVDLTPRSIMYIENRGQHPRLNKFYLITTLLDISVDQFFFPCNEDGDNNRRKQVDVLLNDMEEKLQFAEKLCALRQNYAAIAQAAETLAANRAEPAVQHACAAICSCVEAGLELL